MAKIIFLHLSVILFTGGLGVSASVHAGIPHPPDQTNPPGTRHPPRADTPWDQTHPSPRTRHTSGRSRIFPRGGANSQKCYYFSILSPKTAWKWKNLGPRGGAHPWCPPLDPPMHTPRTRHTPLGPDIPWTRHTPPDQTPPRDQTPSEQTPPLPTPDTPPPGTRHPPPNLGGIF